MKICPVCEGYGYVEWEEVKSGPDGPIFLIERGVCDNCEGNGDIAEEVTE